LQNIPAVFEIVYKRPLIWSSNAPPSAIDLFADTIARHSSVQHFTKEYAFAWLKHIPPDYFANPCRELGDICLVIGNNPIKDYPLSHQFD
jgi:hypothetical protein